MSDDAHPDGTDGLAAIRELRVAKLDSLREAGIDPYPAGPFEKASSVEAVERAEGERVAVAGRIMLLRSMGNATFLTLRDEHGDIQVMLSKKVIDAEPAGLARAAQVAEAGDPDASPSLYKFWLKQLDMGDIVGVEGERMTTRTGEPTVMASTLTMLSKSLLPLPDKHHGLADEEARLRKRYLDILMNRDVQEMVYRRARFWKSMRAFLDDKGFIEVQTPVLEHTTGGADAKPFVTHHNFLDMDVCLRISMGELWQKRLLVAGFEKTFEIGRQFRNENQSREHLNDYEQMEFYWAYANYEWGVQLVEELFKHVIQETFGTLSFELERFGKVHKVDLSKEWERYDFVETIERIAGIDVMTASDDELIARMKELKIPESSKELHRARAVDLLWKHCRKELSGPGFLVNEPLMTSPLAKRSPTNPNIVERFHVIIAGSELGNGYSELNDPLDQAERFTEQQAMRDAGDAEAQMADFEFVEALEHGMPPACGFGMSERVFAFFMDKSVRECQIFPLLKPLH